MMDPADLRVQALAEGRIYAHKFSAFLDRLAPEGRRLLLRAQAGLLTPEEKERWIYVSSIMRTIFLPADFEPDAGIARGMAEDDHRGPFYGSGLRSTRSRRPRMDDVWSAFAETNGEAIENMAAGW